MTNPAEPTDPEDAKIITLARASLARSSADQGACVRDVDGRTYAASSVSLPHLQLSALAVAVAMAISSGATGFEAAALCGDPAPSEHDQLLLRDFGGSDRLLWWVDRDGAVRDRLDLT